MISFRIAIKRPVIALQFRSSLCFFGFKKVGSVLQDLF